MEYKPSDFFVSVIDFFAVLLPGAIFTVALTMVFDIQDITNISELLNNSESRKWTALVVASYFFGHFIFLIGSFLDYIYNPIAKCLPDKFQHAYNCADGLRVAKLGTNKDALNTYQWSKTILQLEHTNGLTSIQRFEADSKFFRSIFVVLIFIGVVLIFEGESVATTVGCLALASLSIFRYAERRWKSNQRAFQLIITKFNNA